MSQINSKPAYNGNSYTPKSKSSAKYQDTIDSFSSRHSSRVTSASTGKTTSDPHIETDFVSDGEEEEAKEIPGTLMHIWKHIPRILLHISNVFRVCKQIICGYRIGK